MASLAWLACPVSAVPGSVSDGALGRASLGGRTASAGADKVEAGVGTSTADALAGDDAPDCANAPIASTSDAAEALLVFVADAGGAPFDALVDGVCR